MSKKQEEFLKQFEPVREQLTRFTKAITYDSELAKDLMSETVLQAYEGLDKLRDKSSFKSWIFTIASRIDKKRRRRLKFSGIFDEEQAEAIPDTSRSPDLEPDVTMLYDALAKLPHKQKEAIVLFEISGLKIEEIAEIQDSNASSVKSRLRRGRLKLKEMLSEKEIDNNQNVENCNDISIIKENVNEYTGGYINEK